MHQQKQPSPWQELATSQKVLFLIYYFFVCIVPIISIFLFVELTYAPEVLLHFIPYGMLIFSVVTFVLLEPRIKELLKQPVRLFFPLLIQACFLAYGFYVDREVGVNSIAIFALSEFVGLLFTLFIVIISAIYKKPLARREHVLDKFIKIFFGLFITLFLWIPVVASGYAYIRSVIMSESEISPYLGIVQFFVGVVMVMLSQKKVLENEAERESQLHKN